MRRHELRARATLQKPTLHHSGIGNSHEKVTTASDDAQAYYDEGLNYLESYVWIEAARSFRQALRADSSLAMAWLGMSRTYSGLDDTTAARAALRRAQSLAGGASPREARRIALRQIQLEAMEAIADTLKLNAYRRAIDSALVRDPDDLELLLVRGNSEEPTAAGRGQRGNSRAVAFYQRVLTLQPDHATAHHYLIHTYETIGNVPEALVHGESYASLSPAIPHAHHMWAHDLRRVGRMDEAIREFLVADSLERAYYRGQNIPPWMDWHHGHNLDLLAGCYQWQGRIREAEKVLDQAGAYQAPTSYEQANRRSLPLLLIGSDRDREAIVAATKMKKGSEIASTQAIAHTVIGLAQLHLRRVDDAMEELAAAQGVLARVPVVALGQNVKRSAVQPYVDELRGELWLATDKKAEGAALLRDVERAYRAVPGPDAWSQALFRLESIGEFARAQGDWELAAFSAEQMMDHDPHYAGSHLAAALVEQHRGNRELARREQAAALAAWPVADAALRGRVESGR